MSKAYQPNYQSIEEIYIKAIVFEKEPQCTSVSIFGYLDHPEKESLLPVDYLCDFSTLTDLLLAAKDAGEPIINAVLDKLNNDSEEYPVLIDVEAIVEGPLKIQDIQLKIYKPWAKDADGAWNEENDECFIIETFELKTTFEIQPLVKEQNTTRMSDCLVLLEMSYCYYLQLLKFDISLKKARKRAGLKNKILFRMAEINHAVLKEK